VPPEGEQKMSFNIPFAATSVGSFPHEDPQTACDLVLACFPEVPVWPQLPATSFKEQMEIQFSEGLPCVVLDRTKERMHIDTGGDSTAELEQFYENYMAENLDHFAISEKHARGIAAMEERLSGMDRSDMKYFKMQVIGPISFGLTVVDENKRAIYYNEMFRDVVVKAMAMKARWQLRKFEPLSEKRICFIDEPILSAFGSSTYVSVHREDVVSYLGEVVAAIRAEGGVPGIHCCGNTEWTIPIDAGVDIISFDAYQYGDTIGLYAGQMKDFLEKGGLLAWGMVPTSEKIESETTDSLVETFEALVDDLASKGIDRSFILQNTLLTASCGTGTVPVDRAERIARETRGVSDRLREKYA
jgi:hypothetical protein